MYYGTNISLSLTNFKFMKSILEITELLGLYFGMFSNYNRCLYYAQQEGDTIIIISGWEKRTQQQTGQATKSRRVSTVDVDLRGC